MKIHREGKLIILIATAMVLGLIFGVQYFFPYERLVQNLAAILGIVFLILIVQFFRNPTRYTALNENHIIAPADGKIVVIEETEEPEYFKDKRIQVSIFMSPLNVHVNRNPISGHVSYLKYHSGKYLTAWHPKSSTENERTSIVIKTDEGKEVLFRQIAGAVARRICYYVIEKQKVTQGKEMGFIKFGSRIDLFLPLDTKIQVKLNDKTKGGETVIATFS
jgi:phosphatidylserine decarboxylase